MAGKRPRKSAIEGTADAAGPSKSPMEESVDALAGVEGALLTSSKRKAPAAPASVHPPKKKTVKTTTTSQARERSRSNSMEQLIEVGDSLLRADGLLAANGKKGAALGLAAAAAAAAASVPDPMATTTASEAEAITTANLGSAVAATLVVPTGFRKKGATTTTKVTPPPPPPPPAMSTHKPPPKTLEELEEEDEEEKAKKTQITYNPDIPMTKEQLTSWRREMRRVRNRESAAASRRKVRDRIEELEDEVAVWKKRYQEVTARLGKAEGKKKKGKSEGGGAGKGEEVQV
eukprot:CAMPEP_0201884020 /NCGR_PEP_ID=MMETSP0902-20130614/16364_1 /ASSEMBLY_ACC=CAM_ASM_000551 /TAXON_ID=420261 /ORGANISM="Thalassiosira antarctica, Strain CCMP982" /LENGTH=288 /DNA_ID=CAMNT_0048412905 /DNA_START=242 /DNA_END=1108 /DNA_ORIENTATION=+